MTGPRHDVDPAQPIRGLIHFGPLVTPIMSLGIGIVLICIGAAFTEEWLVPGLAILVTGSVFLGATLVGAHRIAASTLPEESAPVALLIPVEFLAGAFLACVGLGNLVLDAQDLTTGITVLAVLGLLLVSDSLVLYWQGFRGMGVLR